jgi:hypothetical protein
LTGKKGEIMREIKFRAWDKVNKRFMYVALHPTHIGWASPHWIPQGLLRGEDEAIEGIGFSGLEFWQQYTGLKDKKGKEIYEGDILKWKIKKGRVFEVVDDPLAPLLGVKPGEISEDTICTDFVEFHDGCFFLICPDTGGGAFLNRENKNAEIIGNIYEHPHLINAKESTEKEKI